MLQGRGILPCVDEEEQKTESPRQAVDLLPDGPASFQLPRKRFVGIHGVRGDAKREGDEEEALAWLNCLLGAVCRGEV